MLIDRTSNPAMQLAVDKTRRKTSAGHTLAAAHRNVGRLLATDITAQFSLEECKIDHSTGFESTGVRLPLNHEPAVVAIMRAGLFIAEGIWEMLPGSALVTWNPETSSLPEFPGTGPVILTDGVINTGKSMQRGLQALERQTRRQVIVATLVGYKPTLLALAKSNPDTTFVAARASERSYVGSGSTDTGARLFGTIRWEEE